MPNYCSCRLEITGDKESIQKFASTIKDGILEFSQLFPCPDPNDWHYHNKTMFGTKWDVCHPEKAGIFDNKIIAIFDTAWQPPLEYCANASQLFPSLTFEIAWSEVGCGYFGVSQYKNNLIIHSFDCKFSWIEDENGDRVISENDQKFLDYFCLHQGG
jgi:hypothetical protein